MEGQVADLVLRRAEPSGTIVGTFTCNGQAMRASIDWAGEKQSGRGVYAHADGSFRLERVEAGAVTITAIAEMFANTDGDLRDAMTLRRQVQVEAGKELRLQLDQRVEVPTRSIRGQVRYPDGQAAAGLTVASWGASGVRASAVTDARGCYELAVVGTGEVFVGVGGADTRGQRVQPPAANIDFIARRKAEIRLRAVDAADGKAVDARWMLGAGDAPTFGPGTSRAPDPEGWIAFDTTQGRIWVLAIAKGRGPVLLPVDVGAEPPSITVRMQPAVKVHLQLADGVQPPPGVAKAVLIDATPGAELPASALTSVPGLSIWLGAGGDVEVAPGRYRVVADHEAYELEPNEIEVAVSTPLTVRLRWHRRQ